MQNERLDWLDVGKGLGMVLVILAHSSIPSIAVAEIYTFHMPLFFFISGYLFSNKKYTNFKAFLSKKVWSLLIPYFCFSLVLFARWLLLFFIDGHKDFYNLYKPFITTIFAIRGSEWSVNGTLWFIACLLSTEVLFYILLKRFKRRSQLLFHYLSFPF